MAYTATEPVSQGRFTVVRSRYEGPGLFLGAYADKDAKSVTISETDTASTAMGSTVQVNGSGAVATAFTKVAGFRTWIGQSASA